MNNTYSANNTAKKLIKDATNIMWESGNSISKQMVKDAVLENVRSVLESGKQIPEVVKYWSNVEKRVLAILK